MRVIHIALIGSARFKDKVLMLTSYLYVQNAFMFNCICDRLDSYYGFVSVHAM